MLTQMLLTELNKWVNNQPLPIVIFPISHVTLWVIFNHRVECCIRSEWGQSIDIDFEILNQIPTAASRSQQRSERAVYDLPRFYSAKTEMLHQKVDQYFACRMVSVWYPFYRNRSSKIRCLSHQKLVTVRFFSILWSIPGNFNIIA